MKMMKKNKNFSTTDGYKSTYNFLSLFHVKQHELMKLFGTDHKDYFYQKRRQMEDTENRQNTRSVNDFHV